MKLLVFNVHFDPRSFGGATIVAENLVEELIRNHGCRVTVVTTHVDPISPEGAIERYTSKTGAEVFSVNLLKSRDLSADGLAPNEHFYAALNLCLDGAQFDVGHIHSIQGMDARLIARARLCVDLLVLTVHDSWWQCERQFMIDREGHYCWQDIIDPEVCSRRCLIDSGRRGRRIQYFETFFDHVDLFLAPSEHHRAFLARNGVPESRLRLNKNGVRAPEVPKQRTAEGTDLVFAFLGGPGAIKGFDLIKEVFENIELSNYRLKLVDAAKNVGKSWAGALGMMATGSIDIVPPFTQETIDSFFSDVDVLLFPSQWKESFGLVVREATIRGIWVIATDCGGPAEDLIDGENATIIPMSANTAPLRDAVLRLLADPEALRPSAKNGCNPAKIRTVAEQANELRQLYVAGTAGRLL